VCRAVVDSRHRQLVERYVVIRAPLRNGRWGIVDVTTPLQAAKIWKYYEPEAPYLLNVTY
jgi:hypothetical protein